MPLHGRIVVIKRSGGDGTEFPLTASCLFGRNPDCDIRIQLPQVSKEHCRIELNENKEVILTNLSSVNPTRVNGEVFQQSECLKHGDLITIIDRSFRFEYHPPPTPKKNRYSAARKNETPQVLHETQARDTRAKDGTNTSVVQLQEDGILEQNKPSSSFCELYQMFKQDLDSKTPKKAPGTPASRLCPQKPIPTNKVDGVSVISTPKKVETENVSPVITGVTPKSAQRRRMSFQGWVVEGNVPDEDFIQLTPSIQETPKGKRRSSQSKTPTTVEEKSTPVSQKKSRLATPQKFTASEVVEQISECPTAETAKTPTRRRSKEATPIKSLVTEVEPPADAVILNQDQTVVSENSTPSTFKIEPCRSPQASPRSAGKKLQAQDVLRELEVTTPTNVKQSSAKKRKSGDLKTELSTPLGKRKRVSFGGHLEPELFDKRLPPDSPLRKGATPGRRSLCVPKMKRSLLRRASAIGLIKEHEQSAPENPKVKGSPGKIVSPKTPSPAKSPPKASPKTPSPAKKTPNAKTPSPGKVKTLKTAVKTPSARRKSPLKDESQTPKAGMTPVSLQSANTTPTVQRRFSVSRISTSSPTADQDSVPQTPVTVTLRVPLRRTSMKSTSKTTEKSTMKNTLQVIRRRSGVPRASMKVVSSWADIVKFGQTKAQAVIPTKKTSIRVTKTKKNVVPKPKTPARKLIGHVSTGHADSPVTIVVGKAHKLKVSQPCGAAPKLVHNIALLKKNMTMDEDLSGVAEMFKTPAKQRKSVANVQSALKTPQRVQSTSMIESVMETPEATGEMVVSPLVVSTAKRGVYNSDAVIRLLRDYQESSFITANATQEEADDSCSKPSEIPALERSCEESKEEQQPESKTAISTLIQKKPEQPDYLTGVKRIMKTPRQKADPIEDLTGKLLKTPKQQKPEQPDYLTGVKRIMKTPRQKADPIEDLTGKLLKTPKQQKPEQPDYLTGVKRIMKTPRQKADPIEDLTGKLLKTPKQQKPEQPECLTGVKRIMKTPRPKAVPIEDLRGKLMNTPRGSKAAQEVNFSGVKELLKTPKYNAQPVEEISGEAQNDQNVHSKTKEIQEEAIYPECVSDAMTTVEQSEALAATPEAVEEEQPVEAVEEVEEPAAALSSETVEETEGHAAVPANAVEEEQPAEAVEEPDAAPSEVVEKIEEPAASLAEAMEEIEEPTAAPAEAVEEEQPAPPAEAVEEVEPVAAPAEAVEVEHLESEEPAAPVKGRGKKTEGIVPPPARPSARRRGARHNESSSVEAQVETIDSVDVQEKMDADTVPAEKPKRGQKAKPASVEQVETVQENTVEFISVPVTEKVEAQTRVVRSKRGRKPKQDSVEVVEEEVLEIPPIEIVEAKELSASVPVEKPRARGTMEEHVAEAVVVEITPTEEMEAPVPVAKPKRGRKTKQEFVEQVESVSVETPVEQVEAQELTTVAPVEKPKRGGRKTKQASVEFVLEHPVESVTVDAEAQEQTVVAPVEKHKRGRTKQNPESVVPPVSTETQEETSAPPTEKLKRGRRAKRKVPEVVEVENMIVQEVHVPAQTEEVDAKPESEETIAEAEEHLEAPVVKSGRGRKARAVVKDEVPAKRKRRGAADSPKETTAAEATVGVPTEPVKRGKRAGKSTVFSNETTIAAESNPLEAEVTDTKKGKAVSETTSDQANSIEGMETIDEDSKNTSKSVHWKPDLEVTHMVTPLPKQRKSRRNDTVPMCKVDEQPAQIEEQEVVKAVRGKRARTNVAVKEETAQSTSSRRAHHSATESTETSTAEATVCISKPVNKRNTARNTKKAEEVDLSDKTVPKEPVKKTRRGAKSTAAAPIETTSTTPTVTEEVPETISEVASEGRGKGSKRAKAASQGIDIEQATESEQLSKPRRGRAVRK
ncbi:proliferation marker protein Ki-67 isoform X2 [Coregonus clupeaformis]|uniref:proliferation marker protein Ki-67 isoform X2 n=1 Tax=Coregonus clupeaformis TaxID=59861 RepID=UPI001BE12734|nr:proliferation marker protein Ki-67 isoform X2 [Coregonus clupeaformis]